MKSIFKKYSSKVVKEKPWLGTKRRKGKTFCVKKDLKRKVFGIKYNIGTYIWVSSFVGPRTCEGHVFVTSFMNDETTDWNTSETVPSFPSQGHLGQIVKPMIYLTFLPWHWYPCFPKPLQQETGQTR